MNQGKPRNFTKNTYDTAAFPANNQLGPESTSPTQDHSQLSDPHNPRSAHAKNLSYTQPEDNFGVQMPTPKNMVIDEGNYHQYFNNKKISHSSTNVTGDMGRQVRSRRQSNKQGSTSDSNQRKIQALKDTYNQVARFQMTKNYRNMTR